MKQSAKSELDILDGYRRIAKDEHSRLGWRIVVACDPFKGDRGLIREALEADGSLSAGLPEEYRQRHLAIAQVVGKLLAGPGPSDEELQQVTEAAERSLEDVLEVLALQDPDAEDDRIEDDLDQPDVLFTSLVGAKGLSAEHVFVVGMNGGHFPRDNDDVTDEEICSMLVALSRTRQQCHVVSAGFFGKGFMPPSVFLTAIKPHLALVTVNKDYDFGD